MLTKSLSDAAETLMGLGNQRVWSLLVTIFGDLAQNDGDVIDGPVLSALMTSMGIKPEATRVALHRLRNDDWITSAKNGRTSQHSLTARGRQESAAASPRIYNQPNQSADEWQLVILETTASYSRKEMEKLGFAPLMPRIYLGSQDAHVPDGAMMLAPQIIPAWLSAQFEPKDLLQDYAALHQSLVALKTAVTGASILNPHDAAVLRCLIVHNWRRLVLKHPDLPNSLYSEHWQGHACHVLVSELLAHLPRPDLGQILPD